MKTLKKLLLTITAICMVNSVTMATDSADFSIQTINNDIIAIELNNQSKSKVQVSLKDEHGSTVFEETVVSAKIKHRKYDLKNLPIGSYTLFIAYDNVIKSQTVTKSFDNVNIAFGSQQTIVKPTFRVHKNYVDVSMISAKNQEVSVEIRDNEGNTIYNEKLPSKSLIQKRYNLSRLEQGAYNFYLKVNGSISNEHFSQIVNWAPELAGL